MRKDQFKVIFLDLDEEQYNSILNALIEVKEGEVSTEVTEETHPYEIIIAKLAYAWKQGVIK